MKKLILLVGIPGSGKTTLAKTLTEKGFERLCADDLRFQLYGNEAEQGDRREVFYIFFKRLKALMRENKDIVIDNTNVRLHHRQQILTCAKNFKYEDVELWVLDTPLELCLKRNKERDRQVEEEILTNLFNELNGPSKPHAHEGRLVTVKTAQDGSWQFV